MRPTSFLLICGLTVLGSASLKAQEAKPAANAIQPEAINLGRPVDFDKDIVPILENNCIACHNLGQQESKLNLEKLDAMIKGGKRGPSIVPKEPDKVCCIKSPREPKARRCRCCRTRSMRRR